MAKIKVSIIIVHYKVEKELFECIRSIHAQKPGFSYEIIVVDNDERKTIQKNITRMFPGVHYIPSKKNVGYGAGMNMGAGIARGEYLFILNPDTLFTNNVLHILSEFLDKNKKFAIIAPTLLDRKGDTVLLQGARVLNPFYAVFALSFISRIFPNNPILRKYWLRDWNKKSIKKVGTVPGTAFMIRRDIFHTIGGFDEKFFLYFEEHDLCLRVLQENYLIGINPTAKIIHHWAVSTSRSSKNIKKIFEQSRFYYFRKHFGLMGAIFTESFLRFGKVQFVILCVLLLGALLRFYKIYETFYIIPDAGWFYLSARDILTEGIIPLVGPPTSHPWIHHGPLWTYALASILFVSKFNPLVPAYFMATIGVVTIYIMYKVSTSLFNQKTGVTTALLYAVSPLVISNSRNPYHTSPIPFFSLIFLYCVHRWVNTGSWYYIPAITFLIGILYNHEITTVAISGIFILISIYGYVKKKRYVTYVLNHKKIIPLSIISFLIPMTPFVLHDLTHGFRQTGGFVVWMMYRLVKLPVSLFQPNTDGSAMTLLHPEFGYFIKSVFFHQNFSIALVLLGISLLNIPLLLLLKREKSDNFSSRILMVLFLFIPLFGLFTHRVPIEADMMLVTPFLIISFGHFISLFAGKKYFYVGLVLLFFFSALNMSGYIAEQNNKAKTNFLRNMPVQYDAARRIIELSGESPYNLKGKGVLDNYPVFTMPYEYLTWWMGKGPVKRKVENEIVVSPQGGRIDVYINEEEKE